jgi:glycosyltransferase involved in cell wall biosynthesis
VVIGGKGADQVPNGTTNVTYAGFVPDAAGFLRSGRVICIPTVMGAGIQLKTIEGISIGRPVVATQLGLRGISEVPDYVSLATDARQMADELVALVRAPAELHVETASAWAKKRRDDFDESIDKALRAAWP